MKRLTYVLAAAGAVCVLTMATAFAADNAPGIQQRELNQEHRIEQGVQSGKLTPKEAGRLEAQQARIHQNEARMSAKTNGNLTAKQKAALTHQQNEASKAIYRKKHNARQVNVGQ